jgi:type I restriction enzyme M protein
MSCFRASSVNCWPRWNRSACELPSSRRWLRPPTRRNTKTPTTTDGLLPGDEVKALKAQLKELNAQARLAKKERGHGDWESYKAEAVGLEQRLARHKAFEDEARQLKSDLRANEKKQQELVEAARAKIGSEEARHVILDRLSRLLVETYSGYLRADQRACVAALENLYAKYAVTAKGIETARDVAAAKLKGFLVELGYE